MVRKIKLSLADQLVEFVDRDLGLRQVKDWANRGTYPVQVVYGPEGCGKTAWLRQSVELLRELGFEVIYVNPLNKLVLAEISIGRLKEQLLKLVEEAISQNALARIAWIAYSMAYDVIKLTRGKVAVIVDDAFQAIGIKESAMYVKALLNLIEYPPEHYERIVTITATSEGASLREIGRHRWAETTPMWNMTKEGFKQLYEQLPGDKPDFDIIWRVTGGNPAMLERLYRAGWDVDRVIKNLIREKNITPSFIRRWANHLREAIEDPDHLWEPDTPEELINELIEKNLIIYFLPDRDQKFWIDQPPPERDLELGIGRYVAWQSPIHREAIKYVLKEYG